MHVTAVDTNTLNANLNGLTLSANSSETIVQEKETNSVNDTTKGDIRISDHNPNDTVPTRFDKKQ